MTAILTALLFSAVLTADDPDACWIEGEAYYDQAGSVQPDRPPRGSRGECLGANWAGRKGDFARYRFQLERPIAEAVVYLRYARRSEPDATFDLFCDTKPVAQHLALASSGGWGHVRDDEWRYQQVRLGHLAAGWHELKLVSLVDQNNTNVDGFFLASAGFQPPETRTEIEAFPQPTVRRTANANAPGPDWVDKSLSLDQFATSVDDWYYPHEESAERAALHIPKLMALTDVGALLSTGETATARNVAVGEDFQGWRVAQTLNEAEPLVVLERELDRWGLIVYLGRQDVVAEVRKAVGRLAAIRRPASSLSGRLLRTTTGCQRGSVGLASPRLRRRPELRERGWVSGPAANLHVPRLARVGQEVHCAARRRDRNVSQSLGRQQVAGNRAVRSNGGAAIASPSE